ncbi:MAG: DUF2256 domain-containing protein [Planctomycetia bacterium]
MGRSQDRLNRPAKTCAACGRPFTWRKKWERCWEQVRYCSDRCRKTKRGSADGRQSRGGGVRW